MHSEHLNNLHPGWVLGGWAIGVALSSGVFLVLVGLGLVVADSPTTAFAAPVCAAVGFFGGGLWVGLRWSDAPLLHGVAIGLVSVVVWFLGELLLPRMLGGISAGPSVTPVLGMILVTFAAAMSGAWAGRRMTLRGQSPSLGG